MAPSVASCSGRRQERGDVRRRDRDAAPRRRRRPARRALRRARPRAARARRPRGRRATIASAIGSPRRRARRPAARRRRSRRAWRVARPADERDDVVAEFGEDFPGERAFRPKAVGGRVAARSASSPICAPEPSSPSAKPRPPTIVSRPATRAIAADPVPAITSPPSAPACAPMHAVDGVVGGERPREAGKSATTLSASRRSLTPARPKPSATRATVGRARAGPVERVADDRAHRRGGGGEIDVDVSRGAGASASSRPVASRDARAAARRPAVDADEPQRRLAHPAPPRRLCAKKTGAACGGLSPACRPRGNLHPTFRRSKASPFVPAAGSAAPSTLPGFSSARGAA